MKKRSRFDNILAAVAVGTALIAIRQELSKPPSERGWTGKVGPIPYDFRPPTPSRIRARYWDPDDERIFVPQLFGVGWTINFGRVVRLLRS
jgi:Family of unknown function (DUF5808)